MRKKECERERERKEKYFYDLFLKVLKIRLKISRN
jgi:hypothetical protein